MTRQLERPDVLQQIRLAHCADHRLGMVRFTRSPIVPLLINQWWGDITRPAGTEDLTYHVPNGQLWWVASDMQLLVEAATMSLPDFPLMPGDVPDPAGIVFYERPLQGLDAYGEEAGMGRQLLVNAMSWSARASRQDGNGVLVIYAWVNLQSPPAHAPNIQLGWKCLGVSTWDLGTSVTDVREDYDEAHTASVIEDRRRLAALWLLASQETIARRSIEPVDRPTAKRHIRAGLEIPTTRVLRLRRAAHHRPDDSTDPQSRDWTHRWVVSGHWRNQWLPTENRHRPTWIAPYVKGPDDKPLVLKETVKALVQ
jgi:hypothetical protein